MAKQKLKNATTETKDFFKLLWQIFLNYKKWAAVIPIAVGLGYFIIIYINSPFWFFVEQQMFKQNEKINQDFGDLKYYDIVTYNSFCQYDQFKFYMKTEPLNSQLRVDRTCKLLGNYYNNLEINVKVRS